MAECQPPETNPALPGLKKHLENHYPTHIESIEIDTRQCSKSEKHPPNGIKLVTTELNGCSKCSSENEEDTGCTKGKEICLDLCCSETERKSSEDGSLNNDNVSSDPAVDRLTASVGTVCLSGKGDEASETSEGIDYVVYESELQMPDIIRLITKDLSEPYSIYTYRYFIHNWPKLCFLAMDQDKCVGAIVCKLDMHKKMVRRGYIAMLAVDSDFRRKKIGSHLVLKAIKAMIMDDCDEVVLETEITNQAALRLYENLGFVRDKRLFRYYLNGVDALRLKLWLR